MSVKPFIGIVTLAFLVIGPVLARTPSPEGANVYIISPSHGEVVNNPVTIRFGLTGLGVAPAGIDKPGTGHHHLLIDLQARPAMDKPLPADANHKHFGGGQTQTTLELSPGKHTLQLIMGDKTHSPHKPPVISEKITIMVK